jgi:hypothetical protein
MTVAIPLIATPAQQLTVQLGRLSCLITVYQKSTGFYLNLSVLNVPVVTGVLCHNDVLLVRSPSSGFIGDLYFHDTQGSLDPTYDGLGDRFVLLWTGGPI